MNDKNSYRWTQSNKKEFRESICQVYFRLGELRRFVSDAIDYNLDTITNVNLAINDIAFELVEWSAAKGYLDRLFDYFIEENPELKLKALKSDSHVYRLETVISFKSEFKHLETLLQRHDWKKADEETARIICKISNREKEGNLSGSDILNFSDQITKTIGILWEVYSEQKFGYKAQLEIYQHMGGTKDLTEENRKNWQKFLDIIEWSKNGKRYNHQEIQFSLSAPKGHLPYMGSVILDGQYALKFGTRFLYKFGQT